MRIERINLEQFGRRSNLALDGLSDQLNVVYGPNGSGKTSTIQFIRWILYGNRDSHSQRYVNDAGGVALGDLSIVQDGLRRKISRHDDGTRSGRLTVDGKIYGDRNHAALNSLMGDISQSDYDLTFAPSFDDEPSLPALLQSAQSRGMELTSRREPSERVQQIRLLIDNYRRDLDRLPWMGQELAYLVDHRSSLQRRIGQIEDDNRRRRVSVDREYEEIARQIQVLESEIARLRGDWHAKDNEVNARRRELEEAWQVAEEARQEFLRVRRNELVEIENQLDRARGMLAEFQRRFESLDRDLRDHELTTKEVARDRQDTICLVQSIANQLDELRAQPAPGRIAPVYRAKHGNPSTIPAPAAAIDSLRNEVGRLCRVMQSDRTGDKVEAMTSELKQLRQCEAEIEQWTSRLVNQRDQIAREVDEAERFGVTLVADNYGENYRHGDAIDPNYVVEMPSHPRRVRAVLHSCDGYEPVEPESDELLRRLTNERETISRDLDKTERQLRQLLDRRRELELVLRRVNDTEVGAVRREIAELDNKIRAAEERERILREIERLEAELSRLRDDIVPSHITSHAVEILRALTRGRYVDIRFADPTSVMVQEAAGPIVPYSQLSRGVRDQLYLSFCMALIAAYRRQGIELPLILNDAFVNVDSEQAESLAAVLSGFASQQHQVLLFTRHRHVADLFRNHQARFLELGMAVVRPVAETTTVDQVRFKPYRAADVGQFANRTSERTRVVPSNGNAEPRIDATPVERERHITQRGMVSFQRGSEKNRSEYRNLVRPTLTTPMGFDMTQPVEAPRTEYREVSLDILPGSTPLDATGIVDVDTARRLAEIGIVTVDEFLRSSPELVDRELGRNGAAVLRPIRRWRYELSLRSLIPGMTAEDARVLVSSGVNDVRALAETNLESLMQRILQVTASVEYRSAGSSAYRPDRRVIQRCIDAARSMHSARSMRSPVRPTYDPNYNRDFSRDFRRNSTYMPVGHENDTQRNYESRVEQPPRFSTRSYETYPDGPRVTSSVPVEPVSTSATRTTPIITGNGIRDANGNVDAIVSELSPAVPPITVVTPTSRSSDKAPTTPTKQQQTNRSSRSTSSRTTTRSQRSRSASRQRTGPGTTTRQGTTQSRSTSRSRSDKSNGSTSSHQRSAKARSSKRSSQRELRFFLDRSDAVVDAPSIGAKTAEKLRAVGIRTVDDFLKSNVAQVAKKLDDSRISASTLSTWKAQTTLCCRIPELRGHDAQILVACDYKTPEQVAKAGAERIWKVVGPFSKTSEGKRIIRGGKAPDRAEVGDWVTWAKSARSLSSA